MCYICTRKQADSCLYSGGLSAYGTGLWCNGNTADFGSVVLGSSPSRPTKKPLISERLFLYLNFSVIS